MNTTKTIIYILFVSAFAFAKAQQLPTFIQEGIKNSPRLKAYHLLHKIAEEKINEARWIPNAAFSAGYFVSEAETRTGAQRAKFSARQQLPWFGTHTARKNYAIAIADTETINIRIEERKLTLEISQGYYRLHSMIAKLKVLMEHIQLLKTYERLALTAVEVGKASAVAVLRLQIRQNDVQQQKELLDQALVAEQTDFNRLLNRKEISPVALLDKFTVPPEDRTHDPKALALHPELNKFDQHDKTIAQAEALNQAEGNPMIGFGLDYVVVSKRDAALLSDNGKDIIMPMISVSLPLFNSKLNSKTYQNTLRQSAILAQKEHHQLHLTASLAKALAARNQARIQYNTYTKNLKQAQDAEEILIKNYETGTIDFNDVLDIQELQLKFQTEQIQAITAYHTQAAVVDYLTIQQEY